MADERRARSDGGDRAGGAADRRARACDRARERPARGAGARGAAGGGGAHADRGARSARHAQRGSGAGAALLRRRARDVRAREPLGQAGHGASASSTARATKGFAGVAGRRFHDAVARRGRRRSAGACTPPTTARASASASPHRTRSRIYKQRTLAIPRRHADRARFVPLSRSRRCPRGAPGARRLLRLRSQRDLRRRSADVGAAPVGRAGRLVRAARGDARAGVRRARDVQSGAQHHRGQGVAARARAGRVRRVAGVGRRRRARLLGRARAAAVRHLRRRQAGDAGAHAVGGARISTTRPSRCSRRWRRRCRSPRRPTARGRC